MSHTPPPSFPHPQRSHTEEQEEVQRSGDYSLGEKQTENASSPRQPAGEEENYALNSSTVQQLLHCPAIQPRESSPMEQLIFHQMEIDRLKVGGFIFLSGHFTLMKCESLPPPPPLCLSFMSPGCSFPINNSTLPSYPCGWLQHQLLEKQRRQDFQDEEPVRDHLRTLQRQVEWQKLQVCGMGLERV